MADKSTVIFDIDGTLVDSVDLHALAWHEAFRQFGHDVSFETARGQIGKGGDKLIPTFLDAAAQQDHGQALTEWRGERFRERYLPLVRPFSAVPDLLRRLRETGHKIAIASSAKQRELSDYLTLAGITELIDAATSSEDAEQSKPAPDIFAVALDRLGIGAEEAIAIGDSPFDAQAAGQLGIPTIGVLCGGFSEQSLKEAGCIAVYPGCAALLACFDRSPLARAGA